jgi:hypothetical protein
MSALSSAGLALMALLVLASPNGAAADTKPQTNREGGVTVKATPLSISRQAARWDFELEISTHAVPLEQDMVRAAVVIDGAGNAQPPLAWDGDGPGGHHRKGVLRFLPPEDRPEFVELRIRGIGGVDERVFRWRLTE